MGERQLCGTECRPRAPHSSGPRRHFHSGQAEALQRCRSRSSAALSFAGEWPYLTPPRASGRIRAPGAVCAHFPTAVSAGPKPPQLPESLPAAGRLPLLCMAAGSQPMQTTARQSPSRGATAGHIQRIPRMWAGASGINSGIRPGPRVRDHGTHMADNLDILSSCGARSTSRRRIPRMPEAVARIGPRDNSLAAQPSR